MRVCGTDIYRLCRMQNFELLNTLFMIRFSTMINNYMYLAIILSFSGSHTVFHPRNANKTRSAPGGLYLRMAGKNEKARKNATQHPSPLALIIRNIFSFLSKLFGSILAKGMRLGAVLSFSPRESGKLTQWFYLIPVILTCIVKL